ncbi:hypothetical protein PIROE2DRAFT_61128 [Piromyces sp. E2]|nr:hypothetical protein PIROE2DRAFT_61128 [Piromyces sp. E2]|eukprot:OUM63701.1 hypothetical protein PIROE2DRAFT_61128 [Piromyces sp. E2]
MVYLKAYKSDEGYIGKIDATRLTGTVNNNLKFIIILDQSGSMGSSVKKFVNLVLPQVLEKLEMTKVEIDLITFSDSSKIYSGDQNYFKNLYIDCLGCTYMKSAIIQLEKLLQRIMASNTKQNIRLLSVSDGALHDQKETLNAASNLFLKVKEFFMINSQAVRFFTSGGEPDTRGLSSMLQFNTMTTPQLIDINANDNVDSIADSIVALFKNDGMSSKENPWNPSQDSIDLINGENIFWMDHIPENIIMENNDENGNKSETEISIKIEEDLTINNYRNILENKINYFLKKLKVLKVVNTQSSLEEMKTIIQYFEKFENHLQSTSETLNEVDLFKLQNRVKLLKKLIQKRNHSVTGLMKEIQNNDKVNQLNSKQLADFLRNVESNKDGKSLSRRGLAEGIDFDDVARKEIQEMVNHFDEIKDIDDTNHTVSFYSHSTTFEGIKTVCELTKDPSTFEHMTAIDIIKLLNIVGVGCDAFIGNYTDPMIYRLKEVYLGCFISLSDVLTASEFSGGKNNLVDFNTRKIIVNVIPVFDDQRIHRFLLKYAPKLLEYTASIGMRRVLMEVPNTYEFLFEAGILKFCQTLTENKTEAAITLFSQFVESYQIASGNHYNYVNGLITKQIKEYENQPDQLKNHIYLDDNSIASMTTVFINMFKKGQEDSLPKVLRHLFCHEIHKVVNKIVKTKENHEEFIMDYLKDLLGIDYEKNGTALPELFQQNENPEFCDNYTINSTKLDEIFNQVVNVMFIPFIPYYLKACFEDDKMNAFKNLMEFNIENVKKYLGINYDFEYFKTFAVVQAFLFRKNYNRMDTDNKKMKIIDLDDFNNADNMVKKYVKNTYQTDYNKRLETQLKKEHELLEEELIKTLLSCDNLDTFKNGFQNGIRRGKTTVKIENSCSPTLEKLISQIKINYKGTDEIPLIVDKIIIILFGKDEEGNVVYNNGNFYRDHSSYLKNIIKEIDPQKYELVNDKMKLHQVHIYRSIPNRHGHSNDLPSYWALGYKSLEEMFNNISDEEIAEYRRKHVGCCFP